MGVGVLAVRVGYELGELSSGGLCVVLGGVSSDRFGVLFHEV